MSKYSNQDPEVHKDGAGITTLSFFAIDGEMIQVSIPPSVHTRLFDMLRVTLPGHDDPDSGEIVQFDRAS